MRRTLQLSQLARATGLLDAAALGGASSSQASAVGTPALQRHMSGGGGPPKHRPPGLVLPTTPLSGFMPTVVKVPRQVVSTVLGVLGTGITSLATSVAVKQAITNVANKLIVDEAVVKVQDLDVPSWSAWLAAVGYTNPEAFKKFAVAVLPKVAGLEAGALARLTATFHKVGYYDQTLFTEIARAVSDKFTLLETEEALDVLIAFASFDHYSVDLFDDLADSITYTNHYLAPLKISAAKVAAGLAAFGKYHHERADTFVSLSRGLSEISLGQLSAPARAQAVGDALAAFNAIKFYPENVEAVLYFARTEPQELTPAQLADAKTAQAGAEAAHGGLLHVYDAATEEHDAGHWYSHNVPVKHDYNLYVFRDSLVPATYSPASLRTGK